MSDLHLRRTLTNGIRYGLLVVAMIGAGITGSLVTIRQTKAYSTQAHDLSKQSEFIVPSDGLLFKTRDGKLAAKLEADEEGGALILYNGSQKAKILLIGTQDGGGLIGITSAGRGSVLNLAGHDDGGSIWILSGKRGKRVVEIMAGDDGGSLTINGPTGDPAVMLQTEKEGPQINGKIDTRESVSGTVLWRSPTGTRPKR